ncbi:5'-nucleotidase/2'%2C3'-cyclic phosphodiesterase and related esterases [Streptococcus suis]|uniref:5'-nucleotidase/2',3'-cyclic phosphodiesterase and related esterases n=1 Tax=Streptococcus suis TaxID=1307 RepID=A0A0Z8U3F8_STRSU|nr:5'-nucleotidase/2'%2C3'-cyclic phosphodiesterase and related esterases [Streptococcus suis]
MDYTDISILHTNDMHSYMENFPKKAQLIADIRDGNEKKGILTYRPASTLRCGALSQTVRVLWSMAEQLSQTRSIRL